MNIQEYLGKIKTLQVNILNFIGDQDNNEEKFENLKLIKHDIKLLLHLLIKIRNSYHRTPNFYNNV